MLQTNCGVLAEPWQQRFVCHGWSLDVDFYQTRDLPVFARVRTLYSTQTQDICLGTWLCANKLQARVPVDMWRAYSQGHEIILAACSPELLHFR
jgi:hypothetical protein